MSSHLEELLVRRGLITGARRDRAVQEQKQGSAPLSATLLKLNIIGEGDLAACLQKEYRLSLVDPSSLNIGADVLRVVPDTLVLRHHLLPISLTGSSLTVAMSDPS